MVVRQAADNDFRELAAVGDKGEVWHLHHGNATEVERPDYRERIFTHEEIVSTVHGP